MLEGQQPEGPTKRFCVRKENYLAPEEYKDNKLSQNASSSPRGRKNFDGGVQVAYLKLETCQNRCDTALRTSSANWSDKDCYLKQQ